MGFCGRSLPRACFNAAGQRVFDAPATPPLHAASCFHAWLARRAGRVPVAIGTPRPRPCARRVPRKNTHPLSLFLRAPPPPSRDRHPSLLRLTQTHTFPPLTCATSASLHVEYPMLFKVENRAASRHTHCGVLEFVADEGVAYMPYWVSCACVCEEWVVGGREKRCSFQQKTPTPPSTHPTPLQMMQNLALGEGDVVALSSASLPKGQFAKLRPHTSDFLDVANPRAVLERTLRGYSCLTKVRRGREKRG